MDDNVLSLCSTGCVRLTLESDKQSNTGFYCNLIHLPIFRYNIRRANNPVTKLYKSISDDIINYFSSESPLLRTTNKIAAIIEDRINGFLQEHKYVLIRHVYFIDINCDDILSDIILKPSPALIQLEEYYNS